MDANDIERYCELESEDKREIRFGVETSKLAHDLLTDILVYPYHLRGVKMEPAYKQVDEEGEILFWRYSGKLPSGILVILTIYND